MDRRTAVASAAAILVITVTGAAAISTNLGVVERAPADPAGQLQPNDAELTTVVVEPAQATSAAAAAAPTQANARTEDDGDEYDDGAEYERDDEHEYEGRDDDD